jgi:hypothetical protein
MAETRYDAVKAPAEVSISQRCSSSFQRELWTSWPKRT